MPRLLSTSVFLVLAAAAGAACKPKPADLPAPRPASPPAEAVEVEDKVDALTPPPPPRPPDLAQPPPRANTLNGDPNGPKQADFDVVQDQAQAKVQACLDAMPADTVLAAGGARLTIKYEVGPDGATKDTSVEGGVPASALACAKAVLTAASFPKFSGSPVRNSFSLTYSRPQAPAPREPAPR